MISSIVLAAGMSTRMGQPKALLDWNGEPLINYQVRQLREAGVDEVIVVLGHRSDDIYRVVRRADCRVMQNARYFAGRAGSLRIGAKAVNRDAEAIIILNVDQPRTASFLKQLIAAHEPSFAATRPSSGGHSGHPVIVSGSLRQELLEATDQSDGLRGVLRRHASEIHEFASDEMSQLDVNTPEEYEAAVRSFGLPV
ncbi:MAG: nucleotidyltransferase family protein [Chloroflexi bacterium]|nr:nucleotidyltransferase family protein [Chloroflexota bacterium]